MTTVDRADLTGQTCWNLLLSPGAPSQRNLLSLSCAALTATDRYGMSQDSAGLQETTANWQTTHLQQQEASVLDRHTSARRCAEETCQLTSRYRYMATTNDYAR